MEDIYAASSDLSNKSAKLLPTSVVLDFVNRTASKMGVDSRLAQSIVLAENMDKGGKIPPMLRTNLLSPKGASGVSQVMPGTYESLKSQGFLPNEHSMESWQGQVEAGIAAIKAKGKERKTTDPLIIAAAYNGGNKAAQLASSGQWEQLAPETKEYLNRLRIADTWLSSGGSGTTGYADGGAVRRGSQADVRRSETPLGVPDPATVPDTRRPSVDLVTVTADPATPPDNSTYGRAVAALTFSVERNREVVEKLIADAETSTADALAEAGKAATAVIEGGQANAFAAELTGTINASNADIRRRALEISNTNITFAENLFAATLAQNLQLQQKRAPLATEIDERMAVGLFDNPLQYLINQTILPGKVAAHNALVRREQDSIRNLDKITAQTKAQIENNTGAEADLYLIHSMAIADAEVAKASAQAATIRSNSSALIAQKVLGIASLRERTIHNQEMLERWRIAMDEKRDLTKLKADEATERAEMDRRIRIIGDMIGVEGASLQSIKMLPKKIQDEWIGRAQALSLGDSFVETYAFIKERGNLTNLRLRGAAEFADMQQQFQRTIVARSKEIQNTWATQHPELASKPPSDSIAEQMAAKEFQVIIEGARDNNMFTANNSNPYKMNHQKGALQFKGNQQNPVYLMVADAYKNKQLVNDKVLFDATQKLVTSGVLSPQEAASSLQEYYSQMIQLNNKDRNLRGIGFDAQEHYRIQPVGARPINLLNGLEAENYFTKIAVSGHQQMRELGISGVKGAFIPSGSITVSEPLKPVAEASTLESVVRKQREKK